MSTFSALLDTLRDAAPQHLEDLTQWLRIPSISSDSRRKDDVARAAQWVATKLATPGLDG